MKISVVTAVYNGRATLPAMLGSLHSQSYRNVEHIVQDGGSTDGTVEYLHIQGFSGMRFASEKDAGIYDALNKGIARATGDVVGLLHADDQLADREVLSWVAEAMADPDIDGVYGDLQYVTPDGQRVVRDWRAGKYQPRLLRRGWMPPHPTLYLRRAVFDRAGLYDTSYQIAGDYEAMLRFLTVGGVNLAYIPRVMVQMKMGGVSNRSLSHLLQKSREDYRAIRKHRIGGLGTLLSKNLSKLSQFRRQV